MSDDKKAVATMAADTLAGDFVTGVINRMQAMECGWRHMDEDMQRAMIRDTKDAVHYMIEEATRIIADQGFDTIPVTVKKVQNDGGKIQITMEAPPTDQHRHELFDTAGSKARLILADPDAFKGGEDPKADPNEPTLPIDQDAA